MLSKLLKNIHSLKKDDYIKKDSILSKIYNKNNDLIKLKKLDYDLFYNVYFGVDFSYDDSEYEIYINKAKIILDSLVYLYKQYKFFVFNDIKSILIVLSACGSVEDFKKFYLILNEIETNNKEIFFQKLSLYSISIIYDNLDVFRFLEKYFDSKKEKKEEKTSSSLTLSDHPFILATKHDSIKIIIYLINKGIDVNLKDDNEKKTALIWASIFNKIESAKLLIEKGAKLEEKDDER